MTDFLDRTVRLGFSFLRAVGALIFDGLIAAVLYLMTQGALKLFFEHRFIGTDGLAGRYFREIGWGNATFAQMLALALTLISIALTAYVVHWYSTGAFRGSGPARRIFWPALVMLVSVLLIDAVLFVYRLSSLLFEADDFRELPSWTVLVGEHLGEWRAWLLIFAWLYPVIGIATGMITQITWSGLRDDFVDWLEGLRGGAPAVGAVASPEPGPAPVAEAPPTVGPRSLGVDAPAPMTNTTRSLVPTASPAPSAPSPSSIGAILRDLERARDGHEGDSAVTRLLQESIPQPRATTATRPIPDEPMPVRRYRLCSRCRSLVAGDHACRPAVVDGDAEARTPELAGTESTTS